MKYQLPTGKTINISFEQYLSLDDEKIQELIASDMGIFVEDPFVSLGAENERDDQPKTPNLDVEELSNEDIEDIKKQIKKDF